jgi:hypothetical protein
MHDLHQSFKFFETANRCALRPEGAGGLRSPGVLTPGLLQEVLYLGKDLRNGRGLWKPGIDFDRSAIDVYVCV